MSIVKALITGAAVGVAAIAVIQFFELSPIAAYVVGACTAMLCNYLTGEK